MCPIFGPQSGRIGEEMTNCPLFEPVSTPISQATARYSYTFIIYQGAVQREARDSCPQVLAIDDRVNFFATSVVVRVVPSELLPRGLHEVRPGPGGDLLQRQLDVYAAGAKREPVFRGVVLSAESMNPCTNATSSSSTCRQGLVGPRTFARDLLLNSDSVGVRDGPWWNSLWRRTTKNARDDGRKAPSRCSDTSPRRTSDRAAPAKVGVVNWSDVRANNFCR